MLYEVITGLFLDRCEFDESDLSDPLLDRFGQIQFGKFHEA